MSPVPSDYGPPRDEAERAALSRILSICFGRPAATPLEIKENDPAKEPRVIRDGKTVLGGLWLIPMGQWWGGRRVSMTGVAAVGTDPALRGKGAANRVMQRAMEELHAQNVALSALYPATQSLYRKAGYEQGGARFLIQVAPNDLGTRERGASLRAVTQADRPAIAEIHSAYAREWNGHLDRGPYIWNRVYEHRGDPAQGFVIEENGSMTGYLFYVQRATPSFQYDLFLTDVVARTGTAARRILGFLGDHGTMVPAAEWAGSPEDPLLATMHEQPYKMRLQSVWMTRVVHVTSALTSRGYPPGLEAKLELEVHGDFIAANNGRHVLQVSGSEGKVAPGGSGALKLHIRGLAALYTGFHSPQTLRVAGLLEGQERDARTAAALFRGPAPWTPDFF